MLREMHLSKTNSGRALFQRESNKWKHSRAILFCCLEVSPYLQDVQAGSRMFPICCSLTPLFPASIYTQCTSAQCTQVHQHSSRALCGPSLESASLQPDSQQADGRNSITSLKTVRHLQNTPVCNHLPPLTDQVGNKNPIQPSRLISIHLPHCYREGKMAPRPFPATGSPCPEGTSPQFREQAQERFVDLPLMFWPTLATLLLRPQC